MRHTTRPWGALGIALAAGGALAVFTAVRAPVGVHADGGSASTPPLASYMGDLQRYAQKLGFAVQKKNSALAGFYVDKIRQTAAFLRGAYPSYDGMPVGALVTMIDAPMRQVREAIDGGRWAQATQRYEAAIGVCNACHAAAQRQFVVITPASGSPPYNQRFAPGS